MKPYSRNGGIFMRGLLLLAYLVGGASTAQAQQTQTYSYDVHGRLITVTRTSGSTSQITTYSLDSADNRTGRTTSAPTSGAMAAPPPAATPTAASFRSDPVPSRRADAGQPRSSASSNAQPSA